jgi:hypothetical protein
MLIPPPKNTPSSPKHLTAAQKSNITTYLSGVISTQKIDVPFTVSNLFGGSKYDWFTHHPELYPLYAYYRSLGVSKEKAIKTAAKEVGHLLKLTLFKDKRRQYQWKKTKIKGKQFSTNEYSLM